jgi:hypothetical protein
MVMGYEKVGNTQVYAKIPFRKNRDARSFICGSCVARGALKPKVTQPEEEHFDLRAWRQSRGLTQFALAETLRVDRSIISKVETGEKLIPRNWEPILAKM